MRRGNLMEWIASRTRRDNTTGCFIWTGSLTPEGYGRIKVKGKHEMVHRIVYESVYGHIDAGMFVCHECDRPSCVNVDHLWVGTHQDNMDDMVAKGRSRVLARYREQNPNARVTMEVATMIRNIYACGVIPQQGLVEMFGLSTGTVSAIILGRRWTNVDA